METQTSTSKSPHPLIWVAAIALIVFCGAGVAALMGWIPTSMSKPEAPVLSKVETPTLTPQPVAVAPAAAKVHAAPAPAAPAPAPVHVARNAPAPTAVAARCAECGVIQSVREIDAKGAGTGLGAVGGAVAGGLLGSQVGHGDGTKIATVLGAVGGGFAGNEIEKRVKTTKSFEITVRFDDGSSRVFTEANAPTWRSGDKVKVVNGVLQSNA